MWSARVGSHALLPMGVCKLRLQPLRDTIDVRLKTCNHCNLGLEGYE